MHFTVKNGKVDSMKVIEMLGSLSDGEREIKKVKKDRTSQQNRYLRGGVYAPIVEYTGYTKDEVHGIMGQKFLLTKTENGKSEFVKSTATLNTQEFSEYVENIRNLVAEYGVYIPSAEEYLLYLTNNINE